MDKNDENGAAAAAGEEEVVQIGAQKHDPAWKHCAMVRSEGRTRLRCAYCGKHFLGGGIHRFKEHLARRPGNACCCPNVPRDVQETMLRSLDAVAAKKKLKLSLASSNVRHLAQAPDATAASNQVGGTESPIHMIPLSEVLDFDPTPLQERPSVGAEARTSGGRKKQRKGASSHQAFTPLTPTVPQAQRQLPLQPITPAPHTNPLHQVAMALDTVTPGTLGHAGFDMEQVSMAVGRFLYDAGVPLEAVNSVYFQPMLEAIASSGGGLRHSRTVTFEATFLRGHWTT